MGKIDKKVKKKEEGLELIRHLSGIISSSLELDNLLEEILEACVHFSGAKTGSILLVDPKAKELFLVKAKGLAKNQARDFRIPLGKGATGYVAKTGKSLIIPDVDKDPKFIRLREKVKSELAVPILEQGRVVGVITVDSWKRNAFSIEDQKVLEAIAGLAGQAIRNARIFQEREERIRRLDLLNRINQIFTKGLDLRPAFDRVVEVLKKELEMERATLVLLDTETGELEIKIADGLTEEQIRRGRYRVGEGITGEVVKTGKSIGVPDISKEPKFLDRTGARTNLKKAKQLSFMCVPLKIEDQVIGVLSVDKEYKSEEQFKNDLKLLEIIASSLTQAIRVHMMAEKMRSELEERNIYLRTQLARRYQYHNIIGQSKPMQEVFEKIERVSKSRATVLIRGESGTGKELVAKAIHFNSLWRERPFIKVDCATIPETLLESELFGRKKGAFTGAIADKKGKFEVADGGTIFLDEIGELSPALQAKLLRVLQERVIEPIGSNQPKAISVRVITATNQNLEKLVEEGRFRLDLYYRLNVVPIYLPPLRERKEDIPLLVEHFLARFNQENNKKVKLTPEALSRLMAYDWPGNVRELENLIERVVVMSEEELVGPEMIPTPQFPLPQQTLTSQEQPSLADLEKQAILNALKQARGVQVEAARILGISLRQLRYRMEKYGIKKEFVPSAS